MMMRVWARLKATFRLSLKIWQLHPIPPLQWLLWRQACSKNCNMVRLSRARLLRLKNSVLMPKVSAR
jgi:hypothetical protein